MKDYELKGNLVLRKGEPIAELGPDGVTYISKGLKGMTNKFLKSIGMENVLNPAPVEDIKPEAERPQDTPVQVEEKPEPEPVEGISVIEDKPVEKVKVSDVEPIHKGVTLPRGTIVESPPKARVAPGHKATLYFQKDGRGYKMALFEADPPPAKILEIIEKFKS